MDSNGYVLDANVVMSLLIGGKAATFSFLDQFAFYSPDFVINELDLYTDLIRAKTKFSDEQLSQYTLDVFRRITIVPRLAINESVVQKASRLCAGIDVKDTAYVSLPMALASRSSPVTKCCTPAYAERASATSCSSMSFSTGFND